MVYDPNPQPNVPANGNGSDKDRRPPALLAARGLVVISGGAVGGLIYDLAVNGNQQALTQLGTLATLGVGGLLALAGAKKE